GVFINPLNINEFIKAWLNGRKAQDDFKHQYVCWKLMIKYRLGQSGNTFRVILTPPQAPKGSENFEVKAYFDEWEYRVFEKHWPESKEEKGPLYMSGRIEAVDTTGVLLSACRLFVP